MKEDMRFTVEWSQRRHILLCSSIIPKEGLPWGTFLYSIDPDCQHTARILKNEGLLIVEDGIVKPNQIVKYNVKPDFDDVVGFLSGVFSELETAVDEYETKTAMTVEEKLEELFAWRKDFFDIEPNEIIQKQLAEADALFRRIRPYQITDEQAGQIERIHSDLYYIHYRMFGNEKEKSAQEFHATKGKYLVVFLEYAMTQVVFSDQASKNVYYELGQYYELLNMWEEATVCAEKLLEIYERLNEEGDRRWLIHIILSERYLMCFKKYPDYEERSIHHMEMAQQYWVDPDEDKVPNLKLIYARQDAPVNDE